jgi:hypothetical protein
MLTWPIDFIEMFAALPRELSGARHCLNSGRHEFKMLRIVLIDDRRRGWRIDCQEGKSHPQGITLNER